MIIETPTREPVSRWFLSANLFCRISFLAVLALCGCRDYHPSWGLEDTPSTLPPDEEMELIDNGEELFAQLDMNDIADMGNAAKSLQQLNVEKQIAEDAKRFVAEPISQERWIAAQRLPLEQWEVYYLKNDAVGYFFRSFQESKLGESRITINSISEIRNPKSPDTPITLAELETSETVNGEFRSLTGKVKHGSSVMDITVTASVDNLKIMTIRDGKNLAPRSIPLSDRLRGPFAVEESLVQKPMKQGEVRKLLTFDPGVVDVVQVELIGRGSSRVAMASGEFLNLFEIEQRISHGKDTFIVSLYVDESGDIKRRYLGARGLTSQQVSKDFAMGVRDSYRLKEFSKQFVALDKPIELERDANKIVFRATSTQTDPFKYFIDTNWQLIHSISPSAADLEVTKLPVEELLKANNNNAPSTKEEFLQSSYFVDWDCEQVEQLTKQWLESTETIPAALKIATGLRNHLKIEEFGFTAKRASEIANSGRGDSLAAATLMCAAARAAKIPSRVGLGLTYNGDTSSPAMQFHAWAEVFHEGKWVPIDCTQSDFAIPLPTVKIADSPMETQNALTPVVKIFETIQSVGLTVRPN